MKKKESLLELLKRLDEQTGQFNLHLNKANRYFDNSAMATQKLLKKHEEDLHKLIRKVKKALKPFVKQKKKKTKKNNDEE